MPALRTFWAAAASLDDDARAALRAAASDALGRPTGPFGVEA